MPKSHRLLIVGYSEYSQSTRAFRRYRFRGSLYTCRPCGLPRIREFEADIPGMRKTVQLAAPRRLELQLRGWNSQNRLQSASIRRFAGYVYPPATS